MVTAELPAFIKPGQTLDVTVSTIGSAKSLRGGTLLMTPLLGADGETYAIAQGNLLVGGLSAEGLDGSTMVVNIPTVGRVPQGATVERMVDTVFLESDNIMMNLHRGDFSTAASVANAINAVFGPDVLWPLTHPLFGCARPAIRHSGFRSWACWKTLRSIQQSPPPK